MQSMAWKRVSFPPSPSPESFALSRRLAELWRLYSGMLRELYWLTILNMTASSQESTTLVWSEKLERHWRRKDEKSCCFTRTTHLLNAYVSSQALAAIRNVVGFVLFTASPTVFVRVPYATFICFLNWRKSWKGTHLLTTRRHLHCKWLVGRLILKILLQRNPSFGETLDQVHFSWNVDMWQNMMCISYSYG